MIEYKKLLVLMILDGWGYCEDIESNVIFVVNILVFDNFWVICLYILILGLGFDVGLFVG